MFLDDEVAGVESRMVWTVVDTLCVRPVYVPRSMTGGMGEGFLAGDVRGEASHGGDG